MPWFLTPAPRVDEKADGNRIPAVPDLICPRRSRHKGPVTRKLLSWPALRRRVTAWRRADRCIVFTNGCFDLLHPGHVRYLAAAKRLGDVLVVGLNSDASVRRLDKSPERPLVPQDARAEVLAALEVVDAVTVFEQDTPLELIRLVQPDVLVKGGDWAPDQIVGADVVRARGGRVRALRFVPGYSTTALVQRMRRVRRQRARPAAVC
jgi:rfaE bifunctional protein nucleotidyltransferase chain/domain